MHRKFNKWPFFLLTLISLLLTIGASAQPDGRQVFKSNCATCHMMDRPLTGPALDGAFERVKSFHGFDDEQTVQWLEKWIRNSQAMIQDGDEYAVQIFNEWNKVPMNSFVSLPEEDILAVIDYIQNWNNPEKYPVKTAQAAAAPAAEAGGTSAGASGGVSTNLLLIILLVSLLVISLILARVTKVLGKVSREMEGEELPAERPFYTSKKFVILVSVVLVSFIGFQAVKGAVSLGKQQNYAPDQPIKYSHKLHAGVLKIDCKYCHYNSFRGKTASIPSVNVCMNCHKYVNKGPDAAFKAQYQLDGPANDTVEIAKIYAAAGWDPKKQEYHKDKQKPVEWVRIHNLPDHVYFNHAQHVTAGKIECQTCHGPVEEYEVMKQFAPLTMGWCITCHRETKVDFNNNGYYDKYFEKYHEALDKGEINGVTVEMIGGTECQKCHY